MFSRTGRQLAKRTLSLARVKLLYSRVTLTRFTTFYFFFAIIACVVLGALLAVMFADNAAANAVLSPLIKNVSMDTIVILDNTKMQTCTSIPNQPGTICVPRLNFTASLSPRAVSESPLWVRHDGEDDVDEIGNTDISKQFADPSPRLHENCVLSLSWLSETIQDAEREDVVTLLIQVWLFSLALIAILNESIPHLGAALIGHAIDTFWAGFRIRAIYSLMHLYRDEIVPKACRGVDVMGSSWELMLQHAIGIFVVDCVILVAFIFLSIKLFRVYADQSFSRVGASPEIHRIYKTVLIFSVCLHLTGFFSLASTAMWIDKICHGAFRKLAKHWALYFAAFIVGLVFQFPWLYIGWVCVRKECKIRFVIFCGISAFLLAISVLMFTSPLYRYIFATWKCFASITATAFIHIVATIVLAIMCRLNYGKGLAHYLQVTDALEGVDFTPVSFSKGDDSDAEKVDFEQMKASLTKTAAPIKLQLPSLSFQEPKKAARRGSSIYYESDGPLKFSSSPPLISELGPPPKRSNLQSPKEPSEKKSTNAPNIRGSEYYDNFKVEKESHPVPTIKPNTRSGGSGEVLMNPPIRSSSARSPPRSGLPANPRAGREMRTLNRSPV